MSRVCWALLPARLVATCWPSTLTPPRPKGFWASLSWWITLLPRRFRLSASWSPGGLFACLFGFGQDFQSHRLDEDEAKRQRMASYSDLDPPRVTAHLYLATAFMQEYILGADSNG